MLAGGCRLLEAGCSWPASGCRPVDAGWWMPAAGCRLAGAGWWIPAGGWIAGRRMSTAGGLCRDYNSTGFFGLNPNSRLRKHFKLSRLLACLLASLWGRFVAFCEEWPPGSADRPPSPVPTPRLAPGFARTRPKAPLPTPWQAGRGQPGCPMEQAGTPAPQLPAFPNWIPILVPILANAHSNTRCKKTQYFQYS